MSNGDTHLQCPPYHPTDHPPSFSNRAHTYIHTTYTLQKQMHPDMHVRVRLHTGLGCP